MFVITFDSKFTIETGATCTSFVSGTAINYYNSSITGDTGNHVLDCAWTAQTNSETNTFKEPNYSQQMLYVYGNAYDIDADGSSMSDAKNVKLRVTNIKMPWAQYTTQSWKVQTQRFQTRTIIEQSTTVNAVTIDKGLMAAGTYASTWKGAITSLPAETTVFMDASITTANPVY